MKTPLKSKSLRIETKKIKKKSNQNKYINK